MTEEQLSIYMTSLSTPSHVLLTVHLQDHPWKHFEASLADYCFYYNIIAGHYDQAITCVTTEDVGTGVKKLLNEVCGWLFLLTTLCSKQIAFL